MDHLSCLYSHSVLNKTVKNTVQAVDRFYHSVTLYLCPLESDISHSPRRAGGTSVLRMSRRPLLGARISFQPAAIKECCRPSLNMIQRALPNLRIISGALLSGPLSLETCDSKKISALFFFFFKCSSELYVCRENPDNTSSKPSKAEQRALY